jgi:hypothetical protein
MRSGEASGDNAGMRYDPAFAPDPRKWLEMGEQERMAAIRKYHERAGVRVPSLQGHAIVHTIVESQLADGHAAVIRALDRLVKGGLDRHEALHAVGSILSRHLFQTVQGEKPFDTAAYDSRLDELTVEGWRGGVADGD